MKLFFLSMAMMLSFVTKSQVSAVSLKASGLTCSMCSNAINKALKTLDFISNVEADISNYTFEISIKNGSDVDFDKIKKKVEGAGFSVAGLEAAVLFNNVEVKPGEPVRISGLSLYFLNTGAQSLNGVKHIRLLNKGFVSSKEYRQHNIPGVTLEPGAYYVTF